MLNLWPSGDFPDHEVRLSQRANMFCGYALWIEKK